MKTLPRRVALAAKAIVSIAVMAYLMRHVSLDVLVPALAAIKPGWFCIAVALLTLCSVLGALRWQTLLKVQEIRLPLWTTIRITFIGIFFNSFLFGSSGGDAVRVYYLARQRPQEKVQAAWSVVADRFVGLIALAIAAVIAVRLSGTLGASELVAVSRVSELVLAGSALFALAFFATPEPVVAHFFPSLTAQTDTGVVARSLRSLLIHRRHPKSLAWAITLSFAIFGLLVLTGAALARSLEMSVSLVDLAAIIPVVLIVITAPISIAGFGVREGAFTVLFHLFNIGGKNYVDTAMLFSLFWFAVTLITNSAGGLFYIFGSSSVPNQRLKDEGAC